MMTGSPHYGTYHHTTREQSETIRSALRVAFNEAFACINHENAVEKILDAGCGLGFLSEQAAKFFTKSSVIGVDLFGSKSLPEGDLKIAEQNMQIEGLKERVKFIKSDIAEKNFEENYFDLIISNLVFHNLGKARYRAYKNIRDMLKTGGFFVIGDFFRPKDKETLKGLFSTSFDKGNINQMPLQYSIMILKK
ncbi:MAG: class I SAM-dependent methyltransferase [Candidatus Thermoplasmatota archaeon]|nr:class I SAM-dependent methyltransferase [Candidatus Thermoplasmatota archaeon]